MYVLTCRITAVLLLVAAIAAAQTNASNWNTVKALTTGTDVRILNGSRTVGGKIEGVTDETLVVNSGKGQETFGQQQVLTVSVRKARHRGRNALIGLAVGAGAGLAIGLGTRPGPNQLKIVPTGAIVGGLTAAGAIVGVIVGVVIPSGGWREVYKK
jgi:hypothetical protein